MSKKAAPGGKLLGLDSDTPNFKKFGTMASPDIMIISRKLVDEHPDSRAKLAIALFKGVEYTNANPEDTAKTVAHYFRKSPEDVLAAMKTFKYFGAKDWPEHMKLHTGADAVPGAVAVRQRQDPHVAGHCEVGEHQLRSKP